MGLKQTAVDMIKSAAGGLQQKRYAWLHKYQAIKVLQQVELDNGTTDPNLIRRGDEYAREVLGSQQYAPWLHVYSAMAGEFREGWIPDNYFFRVVAPALQGDLGHVSHLKSYASLLFPGAPFPDRAYWANGLLLGPDGQVIPTAESRDWLFAQGEKVVFKTDHSYQGMDIRFFKRDSFEPDQLQRLGNGMFQEFIVQHEQLQQLSPQAVANIRITTVSEDDGNISVRAAYLRIARDADTHVRSASHIRIPIALTDGSLAAEGYLPNWRVIQKHPDNGKIFEGIEIPGFTDCLEVAHSCHAKVPFVRTVGWDMTVDSENKVQLMEWNGHHNDNKFSEATQGPCFTGLGWENLRQI